VGEEDFTRLPEPVTDVVPVPPREVDSVPAVSLLVFKLGILATSRVPDAILVAFSAVSPDPSPKNVPAVTFPVTILFEFTIKPVVAFVNSIVVEVTLPFSATW
jgi:hypothetical protein